jgi:mono/diheme cytochrome c family protein
LLLYHSADYYSGGEVWALPFNQDMVGSQLSIGDMQRANPAKSLPKGADQRYMGDEASIESAARMVNPVPPSDRSIRHGERLYQANCSPCHGRRIDGKQVEGGVQQWLPGLPLFEPMMKDKPDGHFFQAIHFGFAGIMPSYSYKFSIEEEWDIVNYIRHVQNGG